MTLKTMAFVVYGLFLCGCAALGAATLALWFGLGPDLATIITLTVGISAVFMLDRRAP